MKNIKLYILLKSLHPQEFKNLKKAVESPLFNTNQKTVKLYWALRPHYPNFSFEEKKRLEIFQKTFGHTRYNDNQLRRAFTDLRQVVEEYLIYLRVHKSEQRRQRELNSIYQERNLMTFFEKSTRQLHEELNNQPFRDLEYYQEQFALNFTWFFHPLTQKHTLEDEALMCMMDSIDMQFILAKFRIGSEMKNRERILSKTYDIRFLEYLQNSIDEDFFRQNPTIQLFTLLFKMYESREETTTFFALKKLLTNTIDTLRRVNQSLFLTQLINYAARQINIGNADFYKEALELYQLGLQQEMVIENGRINEAVFGNIALLGCHAKEFEWTKEFINTYYLNLEKEIQEDALALNTGLWYFHQDNFENAYSILTRHSFSYSYQIRARTNIIIILFEHFLIDNSFYDLLLSRTQAFEKFLLRDDLLSENRKKANQNFLIIIKKLAKGIFQRKINLEWKNSLKAEIKNKTNISAKKWLLKIV